MQGVFFQIGMFLAKLSYFFQNGLNAFYFLPSGLP